MKKSDENKVAEPAPRIAVAVKTFGNNKSFEGIRVKAGTRFAIEKPVPGLPLMKIGRFTSLKTAGLVRELGDPDLAAAPGAAAFRRNVAYAEQGQAAALNVKDAGSIKTRVKAATATPAKEGEAPKARPSGARAGSRKRTQVQDPAAPAPMNQAAQNGSPTGEGSPASSSPAVQALTTSTFQKRGNRRA